MIEFPPYHYIALSLVPRNEGKHRIYGQRYSVEWNGPIIASNHPIDIFDEALSRGQEHAHNTGVAPTRIDAHMLLFAERESYMLIHISTE